MKQAVIYTRVSTSEQGKSGLGLAAQESAIRRFCEFSGFEVVGDYQDIASGKLPACFRDGLNDALEKARKLKCPVIVAKLDRLSRSVSFISTLMDSGVPFICADIGADVDPFTLHIHASVAERERKLIGIRTKAGIAEKLKRGGNHGNRESLVVARVKASETKSAMALKIALSVYPMINALVKSGDSLRTIAKHLNQSNTPTSGITANKGAQWTSTSVSRIIKRAENAA